MLDSWSRYGYFQNQEAVTMKTWFNNYRRGLRLLSEHNPSRAIYEFRLAADACPATQRRELAHILYFFGLALERTGRSSMAARSWISARRLERKGHIGRTCDRWINDYGMRRRSSVEADDFYAFRSIQVSHYLCKRGSGRFGSRAEHDVVYELITDAFKRLWKTDILTSMKPSDKLALFRRARVDLPFLYVEDALDRFDEPIQVDFRKASIGRANVSPDSDCQCGSGTPNRKCCGRISSCFEVEAGSH